MLADILYHIFCILCRGMRTYHISRGTYARVELRVACVCSLWIQNQLMPLNQPHSSKQYITPCSSFSSIVKFAADHLSCFETCSSWCHQMTATTFLYLSQLHHRMSKSHQPHQQLSLLQQITWVRAASENRLRPVIQQQAIMNRHAAAIGILDAKHVKPNHHNVAETPTSITIF